MASSLPFLFTLWRSTSDFTWQALEVDQLLQLKCMLYSDFLSYNILFIPPLRVLSSIPYCIYLSHLLEFLLIMCVSYTSLVFDDLDSFENYWSKIFSNGPQLGCV